MGVCIYILFISKYLWATYINELSEYYFKKSLQYMLIV